MAVEIDLTGRVALVTGGSRGLGRADALTLARAGADVAIADILVESDTSAAEEYGVLAQAAVAQGMVHTEKTVEEIQGLGRRALAVRCDVTDRSMVDAAVARVVDELGAVDILVNNAGTLDHVGQFPDQRLDLWERDLRVNLTGAFNCSQAVWPHMKERGWGRIVNMASVAGTLGGFGQASYSTTKAGILGLTRTLAMEGGRHGITCNAIVPGIIGTEAFHMANAAMNERIANRTVFKRPGEPQDIANAIAFLCSDLAAIRDGDRAQRLRRGRALRLLRLPGPISSLDPVKSGAFGGLASATLLGPCPPARRAFLGRRAGGLPADSRCVEPSLPLSSSCCSSSQRWRSSPAPRPGSHPERPSRASTSAASNATLRPRSSSGGATRSSTRR